MADKFTRCKADLSEEHVPAVESMRHCEVVLPYFVPRSAPQVRCNLLLCAAFDLHFSHLCGMQDAHGIPLLGYAAGIANPRLGKLLETLLHGRAQHSLGLIACACSAPADDDASAQIRQGSGGTGSPVGEAAEVSGGSGTVGVPVGERGEAGAAAGSGREAQAQPAGGTQAAGQSGRTWIEALLTSLGRSGRVHPRAQLRATGVVEASAPALERLELQRSACSAVPWDWLSTAGLPESQAVWSCLELGMLADYPSRTQVLVSVE